MEILVFYFSGNGNTKWTLDKFKEIAYKWRYNVEPVPIETLIEGDLSPYKSIIEKADIIGFGTPIYGSNLPRIMSDFINNNLSHINQMNEASSYMFINTFGYVNGFGNLKGNQLLKSIHKKSIAYVNVKLFNSAPSKKDHKLISEKKIIERKKKAEYRLNELCKNLAKGKTYTNGLGPHLLIGVLIRNLLKKGIENNYKAMACNQKLCTNCGQCILECPTKSIFKGDRGVLFTDKCTSCMRCYNNCPVQAISVSKYSVENGYKQYRVRLS